MFADLASFPDQILAALAPIPPREPAATPPPVPTPSAPTVAAPAFATGPITPAEIQRALDEDEVSALIDPEGVIDRLSARRELASKFQLVADDSDPETRAPNAMTQAAFERMATTYSDIRRGFSDIKFDPGERSGDAAAAFKTGAMTDIASIMQTPHGRALVSMLHDNARGHKTTLGASATAPTAHADVDTWLDTGQGDKTINGDGSYTPGRGESTRVNYLPGVPMRPPGASEPWLPIRSDVVLYHELSHALDMTHGLGEPGTVAAPTTSSDQGVRRAEYKATGLGEFKDLTLSENAYRRDRKRIAASKIGVRDGDETMPERTQYNVHTGA